MGTLGCFVRTGWAGIRKDGFACCATSTAEKARADCSRAGSPANWRCIVLEKLSRVKLLEIMAHGAKSFPACLVRRGSRY